jgi:nucleotide-binding universal stress UspA family protein
MASPMSDPMHRLPTIVAGYDGSPAAARAVRFAAEEAARRDSVLRILHVRESIKADAGVRWETVVGIARGYLDGHRVAVFDHTGWPASQLLVEGDRADLLVLGRGGPYRLGEAVGSVAQAVITSAHCPVVVVAGSDRSAADPDAARAGVVAGIKHLDVAESILSAAFAEAELRGCDLLVVHAWRHAGARGLRDVLLPTYEDPACYAEQLTSRLNDVVGMVAGKYPDVPVSLATPQSGAVPALTTAAQAAALVVVGVPRAGPVRGALLGSAGQTLLRDGECPVMFVPRT